VIYLLNDREYDGVCNLPILATEYLKPSIDLSRFNSLIITSKNALTALEAMEVPWREKHLFVVGDATAKLVESLGAKVHYSAEGYGEELAKAIIRQFPMGRYLYCRGKEVATDIGILLRRSNIKVEDAVVYTTRCEAGIKREIPDSSVIIFTSPKTVRCFFNTWKWSESWHAVAIGKTTKKALPKDIDVHMPNHPSIDEAVALARGLEN